MYNMQLVTAASTSFQLLHGRHQEDITVLTKDGLLALLDTTPFHDLQTFKVLNSSQTVWLSRGMTIVHQ